MFSVSTVPLSWCQMAGKRPGVVGGGGRAGKVARGAQGKDAKTSEDAKDVRGGGSGSGGSEGYLTERDWEWLLRVPLKSDLKTAARDMVLPPIPNRMSANEFFEQNKEAIFASADLCRQLKRIAINLRPTITARRSAARKASEVQAAPAFTFCFPLFFSIPLPFFVQAKQERQRLERADRESQMEMARDMIMWASSAAGERVVVLHREATATSPVHITTGSIIGHINTLEPNFYGPDRQRVRIGVSVRFARPPGLLPDAFETSDPLKFDFDQYGTIDFGWVCSLPPSGNRWEPDLPLYTLAGRATGLWRVIDPISAMDRNPWALNIFVPFRMALFRELATVLGESYGDPPRVIFPPAIVAIIDALAWPAAKEQDLKLAANALGDNSTIPWMRRIAAGAGSRPSPFTLPKQPTNHQPNNNQQSANQQPNGRPRNNGSDAEAMVDADGDVRME